MPHFWKPTFVQHEGSSQIHSRRVEPKNRKKFFSTSVHLFPSRFLTRRMFFHICRRNHFGRLPSRSIALRDCWRRYGSCYLSAQIGPFSFSLLKPAFRYPYLFKTIWGIAFPILHKRHRISFRRKICCPAVCRIVPQYSIKCFSFLPFIWANICFPKCPRAARQAFPTPNSPISHFTGHADGKVRIWQSAPLLEAAYDQKDYEPLLSELQNHTSAVNIVRWSPDGRYLASGGDDKAVILWELRPGAASSVRIASNDTFEPSENWQPKAVMRDGHNGDILDLCWSPDGTKIATASIDNRVSIWDVPTQRTHCWISLCLILTPVSFQGSFARWRDTRRMLKVLLGILLGDICLQWVMTSRS